MVDYYELLGVHPGASTKEIKSAYRALARVMHPDAGGTTGTFRLLQEAYETLSDPSLRGDYDRSREHAVHARPEPRRRRTPRPGSGAAGRADRLRDFGEDPGFVPQLPELDPETIGWWWEVNPGRRVRHLTGRASGDAPLVAVAVALLLLLFVLLAAGSSPLGLVAWLMLVLAAVTVPLARRRLAAVRVGRALAVEFGGRRVFGRPGGESGQLAEQLTAELIAKYLIRLPGVRVFHGLARPGSVFADVDHAVLCGQRLVLIESKMWLPGHYTMDEDGELWRNNHPFRGGTVRLPDGVAAYRRLLPGVQVRGALLIYPSRAGQITTGEPPDVPVPPMNPERFVREIGEWLAAEAGVLAPETFRKVLAQVVVS